MKTRSAKIFAPRGQQLGQPEEKLETIVMEIGMEKYEWICVYILVYLYPYVYLDYSLSIWILYRYCIDIVSILYRWYRYRIDIVPILYRYCIESIDAVSILYRFNIATISISYRNNIDISSVYQRFMVISKVK